MAILFLSTLIIVSTALASLPCPSGNVAVLSPSNQYLECTNSTKEERCGSVGSCEIVSNPLSSKSQQVCCISSSLLCPNGQFMYGGRCYEENDLPTGGNGNSSQQLLLQQFGGNTCQLGQVSVNGQCLSLSTPGSACQVSQQCVDSSTCTNNKCTCTNFNAQVNKYYCIVPSTSCSSTQTWVNGQCVTYTTVGNPCGGVGQCIGGSSCVNSMCTCPSNLSPYSGYCVPNPSSQPSQCSNSQVLVNGQCQSVVAPGKQCISSLQCLDRSTCTNSICQCTASGAKSDTGYCLVPSFGCSITQTSINGQCVSYAIPGSPCQYNQQCIGGSSCVSSTCSCPQGTTSLPGYCVSSSNNGGCPQGQVIVNGQCLSSVQLGGFCQAVQQCPANTICQGTCQCQSGFTNQNGQCVGGSMGGCQQGQVNVNGQCLSLAAPGVQCQDSLQCIDSSSCINNRCTCTNSAAQVIKGYCLTPAFGCSQEQTSVNGQCLPFAQSGSQCQHSQQCVGRSTCINGICACPSGTTEMYKYCIPSSSNSCQTGQVQVNGQCASVAKPGTSCQATAQCLDSSTCTNSICSCSNGQVLVFNYCVTPVNGCSNTQTLVNGACVTFASPGQGCTANQQCLSGSTCNNGMCTCPSGRSQFNGYCVPTGNGGTGGCPNGQVLVNGQCVTNTPLGGQCQQVAQCGDNTQCSNGICQCAFGFQQVQGNCVRSGDSSCPRGQVSVNGQCLSLSSPGSQCVSSLQCIDNSNCINGMCNCAASNMQVVYGYCVQPGTSVGCEQSQIRVNGQCVKFSIVGQYCMGNEQCIGGSSCMNGQCKCPMGRYSMNGYCLVDSATGGDNCNAFTQVLVNGVCYNLVQSGQQCQISQQCIGGGQCFNSVCQNGINCPSGQVAVNGQCLNMVQPGSFCQASQQCIGGGQCISNVCQTGNGNGCASYQVQVSGQCLDTVSIGQQCTVQQQCINNANCLSNRCQCNSGFTFNGQACLSSGIFPTCTGLTVSSNGQCLQLAAMNQFCSETPQCMGFSVCISSTCQCPYAYSSVNGICRKSTTTNTCPTGQVMSPSGVCLNMVGIGGSCEINQQCPSGASCSFGRCTQGSTGGLTCNDPNKEVAMANGQPINCQIQLCPSDAQCELAQQQFVCCRPRNSTGGTGYCPSGQSAELLPSGSPKNCLLQACSSGRVCQYSSTSSGYVCCGNAIG